MDNFADDKKPAIFENFARGISEIDCALDSITKTKLFRQADRCIAYRNHSTGTADFLDDVTAIVRFDLLLHRRHHVRRAEVHFFACGCAAGNQVRAHVVPGYSEGSEQSRIIVQCRNGRQRCFASLNMTQPSGGAMPATGVRESSTRCTLGPIVASSGWVVAMFTGVPVRTSAKNFAAASPFNRMQPCVRGTGCTKPW